LTDTTYRNNAILFNGEPISHLPTARLFAYATHFDAHPMGLEWVDDQTCVLVFASKKDAREAFPKLTKPVATCVNLAAESSLDDVAPMTVDDPVDPDYTSARPFPVALWPPEERINQSLGQGQRLKGPIRMRWARVDDVKKKGAKHASQFYKKHGSTAGKELFNGRDLPPTQPAKRKRQDLLVNEETWREELDKELDDFLAEDEAIPDADDRDIGRRKRTRYLTRSHSPSRTPSSSGRQASPPSKMRSDYISNDGRTLFERTSLLRYHPVGSDPLADGQDGARLILPLPRRQRGSRGRWNGGLVNDGDSLSLEDRIHSTHEDGHHGSRWDSSRDKIRRDPRRERRQKGGERPMKTQKELDDELDAFLSGKD
jgi:hypothetical protein